jgi:intracellular sulfur oxidation DsrE/DsrF family protein
LKGKKVSLEQLYDADQSSVVPSGVAEVAKLQGQGFSYLRP